MRHYLIGQWFWIEPFYNSIFYRPSKKEISARRVMPDIIRCQKRLYIPSICRVFFLKSIAQIDHRYVLCRQPIQKRLVKKRLTLQGIRYIVRTK